jgi:Flp pilus assembly protein TadG
MDQTTQTPDTDARPQPRSFVRDEDGTILLFTIIIMIVMFILGGMAVDIMKYEVTRTELQQTADRATLAATSLTQDLDSTAVVNDYFVKAGLADKLTSVTVTNGLNFRTVRTEARADTNPIFLRLYNRTMLDQLEARALSIAEQRISNVEIILVLDVSGSMQGRKLRDLKTSASEFIDTVLDADRDNKISIGIVPYNGQVNMTQSFQNLFTGRVDDHDEADVNCLDLPAGAYTSLTIPRNAAYPVTAWADGLSSYSSSRYYGAPNTNSARPAEHERACMKRPNNVILPPTNNKTTLKNHISGLSALGRTSINVGMKWATTLLDPGSRSVIDNLVGMGQTPSYFSGRPYEYGAENVMKVVVLMTDGEHTPSSQMDTGYRVGDSGIYLSTGDGNYSRYQNRPNTSNDWWVPHLGQWRSSVWNSGQGAPELTWPQVWDNVRVSWVARQLYARAENNSSSVYTHMMNAFQTQTNPGLMDRQLTQVCNLARDSGIIVYSIAFETDNVDISAMRGCASTEGHFFTATGLEIQTAFRAIASNISQLRLTE